MPTWSEILKELQENQAQGQPPSVDFVRRKYLKQLHEFTKRDTILYASCWTSKPELPPSCLNIADEDLQGLMEVIYGLSGSALDLILHTPGGSLEVAEAFVSYLSSKFTNIRIIVPSMAMSAGTMIACSGDIIVLGKHSFLGPTDPQILLPTPTGIRMVSTQSILDQFDRAQKECQDPKKLSSWVPMLNQYGPDLLIHSEKALKISRELVENWLSEYILNDQKDKAPKIAKWLSDNSLFKTHSRRISREQLKKKGLKIQNLEENQKEQDLFLSVFHATTHTFTGTPATKIIENHLGNAFIKAYQPPNAMPPPIFIQQKPKKL